MRRRAVRETTSIRLSPSTQILPAGNQPGALSERPCAEGFKPPRQLHTTGLTGPSPDVRGCRPDGAAPHPTGLRFLNAARLIHDLRLAVMNRPYGTKATYTVRLLIPNWGRN